MNHVMRKPNHSIPYANTKDADQSAQPHSPISAFAVRCLDNIIPRVLTATVAEKASLSDSSLPGRKPPNVLFVTWFI